MGVKTFASALAIGLAATAPVQASDQIPCKTGMVCANDPAKVLEALIADHPGAKIESSDSLDPMIKLTSADGYGYNLYFDDCDEAHTHCASLDFRAMFSEEDNIDVAFVNSWNVHRRLIKASRKDDGKVNLDYDLTTVGGVSRANFVDLVSWWESAVKSFAGFDPANPTKE